MDPAQRFVIFDAGFRGFQNTMIWYSHQEPNLQLLDYDGDAFEWTRGYPYKRL